MPRAYLDKAGNYYESDGDFGDTPVPNRPSVDHEYRSGSWQFSTPLRDSRAAAEKEAEMAEIARPAMRRLVRVLARRLGTTPQQLIDEIRSEP